jgi:nucleoside-diphosphate-sugar epimerase
MFLNGSHGSLQKVIRCALRPMIHLPHQPLQAMSTDTILVIGSSGQIGTELVVELRRRFGSSNVVASDIKGAAQEVMEGGPFEQLDVLDRSRLDDIVAKHGVTQVYLLAALLSATAEAKVMSAWKLNMEGLFNVLELAREGRIRKVYWPSSIAVFGPNTPKVKTPQFTVTEPSTVYGVSKLAGERWCEYYHNRWGVDVRGLRYPGLIGYKSEPGGGTTDYAVDIFHKALAHGEYTCYLTPHQRLPMMYMPDAIKATIGIMDAPADKVRIRSSYNLSAIDFTPYELGNEIQQHIPNFKLHYAPDHREQYAASWPDSIDDTVARTDWGWQHDYGLKEMVADMLANLRKG